ncbi:hypothetical protein FKM82_010045 [Ascaphus truei]
MDVVKNFQHVKILPVSALILSSTVIISEWRRFSASRIFPSEATIASYLLVA